MLWDIRTRMKPALQVIDMIPNVHRTPALAALRHNLRLTPWRMMLIEGLPGPAALSSIPGLITDPVHPLLRLRACPGAPFCPQAMLVNNACRAIYKTLF